MQAGRMRHRATILRRAVVAGNPNGAARGGFAVAFTRRAALRQLTGNKRLEAGLTEDQTAVSIRLYADAEARTITIADRVTLSGPRMIEAEWSIDGVSLPDASGRFIDLDLSRRMGG